MENVDEQQFSAKLECSASGMQSNDLEFNKLEDLLLDVAGASARYELENHGPDENPGGKVDELMTARRNLSSTCSSERARRSKFIMKEIKVSHRVRARQQIGAVLEKMKG